MKEDIFTWWYRSPAVLYKISRRLVGRELTFLGKPTVRCLKAHTSHFLKRHLDTYDIYKNKFMLYHSIAHLRNMPFMSYNFASRKLQSAEFFKNYDYYVVNYDFVIDFDSDDVMESYNDMMLVHHLFMKMEIEHEVVFSGKKGFHLEVKNIPFFDDLQSRIDYYRKIALYLRETYSLDTIDLDIYDQVRIWKAPYSIDSRTGLVVLPLKQEELDDFDLSLCEPHRIISDLQYRKDFILFPGKPENINKFKDIECFEDVE